MLDYGKYSTVADYQQDGDWELFYKVAKYFVHKVKFEDRQDFLHDLMLGMAEVKVKYEAKGKTFDRSGTYAGS